MTSKTMIKCLIFIFGHCIVVRLNSNYSRIMRFLDVLLVNRWSLGKFKDYVILYLMYLLWTTFISLVLPLCLRIKEGGSTWDSITLCTLFNKCLSCLPQLSKLSYKVLSNQLEMLCTFIYELQTLEPTLKTDSLLTSYYLLYVLRPQLLGRWKTFD